MLQGNFRKMYVQYHLVTKISDLLFKHECLGEVMVGIGPFKCKNVQGLIIVMYLS